MHQNQVDTKAEISTLNNLIKHLNTSPKNEYAQLADRLSIPMAEFKKYAFWGSEKYTRNCLIKTSKYELILLCWEPGQCTPIHCHNGEECWVHMLRGELVENRYHYDQEQGLKLVGSMSQTRGENSYMDDDMGYHSLSNTSDRRAMSLHLYAKPISECSVYDGKLKKFVWKKLKYTSLNGIRIS